jgi:hypothetical protein
MTRGRGLDDPGPSSVVSAAPGEELLGEEHDGHHDEDDQDPLHVLLLGTHGRWCLPGRT